MPNLTRVRPQGGDLALERVSDVHVVVGLAATDQPDLRDIPRLKAFVLQEVGMGEGVACVRVDGGEGKLAGRSVVGVTARTEAGPVPLGGRPWWLIS